MEKILKRCKNKTFLPKNSGQVEAKNVNVPPKFTTRVTGHRNIKTYLYKYKIIESQMCSCENQ